MEITGKIIQVLPEVGDVNKAGNEWRRQEYVLETYDQYPKKAYFQILGADKTAQTAIQSGEELIVSFDIDSCEYQGRWFTSISVWEADRPTATAPQVAPVGVTPDSFAPASVPMASALFAPDFESADPIGDLPF